ncbi:hypothetical protein AK812_SmicGene25461 [Symbiodinium microadriaticum]|uniref:SWIM-type domain-containing protein n=1 Tax=Symbiodinium microadriaticum TaxID=2951 RepID=A0A1Q9DC30_SYMMI|nr:hypothetical protein AK812_SmicGene25461 [Symbiodinium microadriaticum]
MVPSKIDHKPPSRMSTPLPTAQLEEAAAEFARFSAYMKPADSSHPSSTAPSATPSKEQLDLLDLEDDADKPKRGVPGAPESAATTAAPNTPQEAPAKYQKMDGKGEQKGTETATDEAMQQATALNTEPEPSASVRGKGRSQEPQRRQDRADGRTQGDSEAATKEDDHRDRDRNDRETDAEKALRKEVKELKNVVKAMGRLTLRLEDRQAVDMLDKEFFLFLQTENSGNSWSVTKRLYTVASEWNRLKETEPESITQPLRSVLLHAFLTALQTQILNIESDANLHQQATAKGLLQDDAYSYLHWNHKTKQHDKAPQQPIDHQALKQCVELMLKLIVFPNTIGNFHPLRKHTANLSSEVLPFALVIQNRNQEAHQLCCCFQHLSRNSCMHLVGATLRPAKLGRTPAAEYLDRLIHDI